MSEDSGLDQAQCSMFVSLLLSHSSISSEPKDLCTVARVCKSWQQAVQEICSANTCVIIGRNATVAKLTSFAAWLPKHASAVQSIEFDLPVTVATGQQGLSDETYCSHMLLQQSLSLAAAGSAGEATSLAAAGSTTRPQRLQLQCFTSRSFILTPAVLSALPAHSLTSLVLNFGYARPVHGPSFAAALAKLQRLCSLSFFSSSRAPPSPTVLPAPVLLAVTALQHLTSLSLSGCLPPEPLVQLLSHPLPLRELQLWARNLPELDMSAMTSLQKIIVHAYQMTAGTVLPQQLQSLHLAVQRPRHAVSAAAAVRGLKELDFEADNTTYDILLPIAGMTQLTQLSITYITVQDAARSASLWSQLQPLRCLHITDLGFAPAVSRAEVVAVLDGLAAASCIIALTKLFLNVEYSHEADDAQSVQVCERLKALTSLQSLELTGLGTTATPGDCLHLTTLTRLTYLSLAGAGSAVGDLAANALACNLTQLRRLRLGSCDLGQMVCLAAIGKLTTLTSLSLVGDSVMPAQGLMMLTGLTGLLPHKGLSVRIALSGERAEGVVTGDVLKQFWHVVQQQVD